MLSILVAAFSLLRQKDIKRMFSYSSIENMGIATFAFGIGGPIATFGALLHMLVHSLTKSAIFFTVGHASQMHGTQDMDRIRGLIKGNPVVGWSFILGIVALVGMPPFGMFASEFLILTATIKDAPMFTPLLLLGLGVAFAAIFRKVQPMVTGLVPSWQTPLRAAHVPVVLHMTLVLLLGTLYAQVSIRLVSYGSGVTEMNSLYERLVAQLGNDVVLLEGLRPIDVPVVLVPREQFNEAARTMNYLEARLVAEWASDETRLESGYGIYACYSKGTEFLVVKCDAPADDPTFPTITRKYVAAYRFERQMHSLMGVTPTRKPGPETLDQVRGLAGGCLAAAQNLRSPGQNAACSR